MNKNRLKFFGRICKLVGLLVTLAAVFAAPSFAMPFDREVSVSSLIEHAIHGDELFAVGADLSCAITTGTAADVCAFGGLHHAGESCCASNCVNMVAILWLAVQDRPAAQIFLLPSLNGLNSSKWFTPYRPPNS